jgi:hypothetical protein
VTKPVLYLTRDVVVTARKLYPQSQSMKLVGKSMADGLYKSGDQYFVLLADDPAWFRPKIAGMEFSRYEIDGSADAECIEAAKQRVRP